MFKSTQILSDISKTLQGLSHNIEDQTTLHRATLRAIGDSASLNLSLVRQDVRDLVRKSEEQDKKIENQTERINKLVAVSSGLLKSLAETTERLGKLEAKPAYASWEPSDSGIRFPVPRINRG